MSVVIEPSEQLEFQGPFTRTSKESLYVKNPSNEPIIFKVKTTAPKQYCVRPNAGRIEPNSEIEVQIILQPFKEELPEDYKCKDKFLVQTAPINATSEQQDITSMWSHVETNDRSSMHQHKIRCAFISPKEDEQVEEPTTIASFSVIDRQPAAAPITTTASVPVQQIPTPAATTSTSLFTEAASVPAPVAAAPADPVAPIATAPAAPIATALAAPVATAPAASIATAPAAPADPVVPIATPPAAPIAAAPVAPAAGTTAPVDSVAPIPVQKREISTENPSISIPSTLPNTTLNPTEKKPSISSSPSPNENELKKALEKIGKLEKELNELRQEGLRARNGRKLPSTVQPLDAVHQHLAALETPRPTEGYPPQVVIGVALLVFIFTYLFF